MIQMSGRSKARLVASTAIVAIAVLTVIFLLRPRPRPVPFPEDVEVVGMTASLTGKVWGEKVVPEFAVPPAYVPRLLALFRPAQRSDYHPLWDEPPIGILKIKDRKGEESVIRFGFSGKNPLCYNFAGIRCVRGGPFESIYVSDEGIFCAECVALEKVITELDRVRTMYNWDGELEEAFAMLERSAGRRPPLAR